MITDAIFQKRYDFDTYNCFHFLCEMLREGFGRSLDYEDVMAWLRGVKVGSLRRFVRLQKPEEGAICLFHNIGADIHVGLFYRGKVLHIQQRGVRHEPLFVTAAMFRTVKFYAYHNDN